VTVHDSIDSVFIITTQTMQINTAGVTYDFLPTDPTGTTWNHILKDATADFDKGFADISAGGIDAFRTGIGIHAAAGITFDLNDLRTKYPGSVEWLSCFAGHDRCNCCPGISLHFVVSDDEDVISSHVLPLVAANAGEPVQVEIPDGGLFLTLAVGAANGEIGCDHGVFADAVIGAVPINSGNRIVSTPGNLSACPPEGGGPIGVNIKLEGSGTELLTVTERAFGPFTQAEVTAQNSGTVSTFVPAGNDLQENGFIKAWLLLGPYSKPGGAAPGDDAIRLDYLTDGVNFETDVQPENGDTIDTDFNGAAASTGLAVVTGINPNATPTWTQWVDTDDTINFDDYYGGNVDEIMMYGVCYLRVAANTTVDFCIGSDDSVQVLLDDVEILIANIARGWGASETCQNTAVAVPLDAGVHKLLVKIFDGGGGNGMRVGVMETGTMEPAAGVAVCLDPVGANPCPLDPAGVRIVWEATRNALNTAGVSYSIDIDSGRTLYRGDIESRAVLGTQGLSLISDPVEYGPFTDPNFTHAHSIGLPCPGTGVSKPGAGQLKIDGAGEDIWQNGDQFMFAYSAVTGDFSARVTLAERVYPAITPISRWGKHGIMARQDCSVRSRYTFIHDHGEDPQDTTRMAVRPTHGGANNFEITPAAACDPFVDPLCNHATTVRLDRCGSEFITFILDDQGFFGGNPGDWVEVGRHDWGQDAPATVQVGLAVTSHAGCNILSANFEDWELLPACDAPVDNLTCTERSDGGLDLAWVNPPSANPAVNITVEVNDAQVATIAGASTSHTIPGNLIPDGQISKISVINSSGVESRCSFPPSLTDQGFIKTWLMLGPYVHTTRALGTPNPPVADMQLDYLRNADGSINEVDIEPKAGDTVDTAYGGDGISTGAKSVRLMPTPGNPNLNPGGVPTWFAHSNLDDSIDYNAEVYNGDITNVLMYSLIYIDVPADIVVDIGVSSDDSVQVLLDGSEIHINSISRGYGAANEVQDVIEDILLTAGCHKLMLKVFEGVGGHGHRLRFQAADNSGTFVIPGRISTSPCFTTDPAFRRGDTDGSKAVNITDMIRILNFLFAGGPAPTCQDTADTDDSGGLNITDGIYGLNFLFAGGRPIPAPGPANCGVDPTADALPSCSYSC
jgi:hypothetical protein